jgi:transposase
MTASESSNSRRKFDAEFKREAVRLVATGGRKACEVARNLGISANLLHRWKQQYREDPAHAFPGRGHLKPEDEELQRLKKQLADVTEERDILKKALAIFSKKPR